MKKFRILVAVQATLTKEVTVSASSKREAWKLAEERATQDMEDGTWRPELTNIDIDTLTVG